MTDSLKAGTETFRRIAAVIFMVGGWVTAGAVFAYATLHFDPSKGQFAPQWVGFAFIGSMCVAIAGTSVRSRHRLTDTIVAAFQAGAFAAAQNAGRPVAETAADRLIAHATYCAQCSPQCERRKYLVEQTIKERHGTL